MARFISICFIIVLGRFASAQTVLDSTLASNYSGCSFQDFITLLEENYPVTFFYNEQWVKEMVVVKVQQTPTIREVLSQTLKTNNLLLADMKDGQFVLVPDDYSYFIEGEQAYYYRLVGNPMEKGRHKDNIVEGSVTALSTKETLPGVTVIDKKHKRFATTDMTGHYTLILPAGKTQLEFSFVGLETEVVDVEIVSSGNLNVELSETPLILETVSVSADGAMRNLDRIQMGVVQMDIKSLGRLPVLMGEPDVIKSLALFPGVGTSGELSAGFHVRGGNTDQNLVLLNKAPVYGLTHLFGLFSSLIPGSIQSVNLHKGTQPASLGSRVSSVTEIKLRPGDAGKIKGKAGLGSLYSTLLLEGPLAEENVSFLLGARSTYSNWLLNTVPDADVRNSQAGFYDCIGSVDMKLGDRHLINLFTYKSHDRFTLGRKRDFNYGSFTGGINHHVYMGRAHALQMSISYTSYESRLGNMEDSLSAFQVLSGIEQINGRLEWDVHLPGHDVQVGMECIHYQLQPGKQQKYYTASFAREVNLSDEYALEGALYLADEYVVTDKISLQGGLRYSWYTKIGAGISWHYQSGKPKNESTLVDSTVYEKEFWEHPYDGPEPRLGLRYMIDRNRSVKVGYHLTRQYVHMISNTASAMPADFWKSADQNIRPMVNRQYSLGFFRNLLDHAVETSVEVYFKQTDHVLEYKNGAVLTMNQHIEQDIIPGTMQSFGLEMMARKNKGLLTGWLSYTIARAVFRTKGVFEDEVINHNRYYPTAADRLHDLSAAVHYQVSRRWALSGNLIFTSGMPATYPEKTYWYHNVQVVSYSDRNAYRLPPCHRLDLALSYAGFLKKTKKVHPSFTLSVYNVYGRRNVYSVFYKKESQDYNLYKLSVIGAPVPSLSLNLNF